MLMFIIVIVVISAIGIIVPTRLVCNCHVQRLPLLTGLTIF